MKSQIKSGILKNLKLGIALISLASVLSCTDKKTTIVEPTINETSEKTLNNIHPTEENNLSNSNSKKDESLDQKNSSSAKETIYLAGGCFWGMQDLLRKQPGILATEVGYMGENNPKADYELVKTGTTELAETVKVVFDQQKISLEKVIHYFFKIHDPTTLNQQGNDKGKQYRSAIFYTSSDQKKIAQKIIDELNKNKSDIYAKNKIWKNNKITTELVPETLWVKAEEDHQDYLVKNPGGYTCHFERDGVN